VIQSIGMCLPMPRVLAWTVDRGTVGSDASPGADICENITQSDMGPHLKGLTEGSKERG
jgi:hypothetical protein